MLEEGGREGVGKLWLLIYEFRYGILLATMVSMSKIESEAGDVFKSSKQFCVTWQGMRYFELSIACLLMKQLKPDK